MLNIVLFGPPGAGKGTQSEKLIEKYKLVHISTGDLFRKHLKEGTHLGKQAQSYMDDGLLVPDEVVIGMVKEKLEENKSAPGFIFDGFPRTVPQASALDNLLEELNTSISGMIILEVEDEELKRRIKERAKVSGRTDDQDENKIKKRIEVYKEETLPVADYYKQQEKYYAVDGIGDIDDIFSSLCQTIDQLQ